MREYDTFSVTRSRNKRRRATIPIAATNAFDAVGELDGQLLHTVALKILGDMSQYEDKKYDGQTGQCVLIVITIVDRLSINEVFSHCTCIHLRYLDRS